MLLFLDGFDHYAAADAPKKWPLAASISNMVTGLLGVGQAARLSNLNKRSLTLGSTTLIIGFRYRPSVSGATQNPMIILFDGSNNQNAYLAQTAGGGLQWGRGAFTGTQVLATAGGLIGASSTNYIEVKVVLATTAVGSVDIHLNGVSVGSVSSIQTINTSATVAAIGIKNADNANNHDWDDLYICDSTGSQNNTFLGDVKVVTSFPTGNGRLSQWGTQVGGTGGQPWTAVNETNPDGDTSYIADNTAGDIEDFTLGSFGAATNVFGVQVNVDFRKDDVSTHTLGVGVGNGSTENFDSGTGVPTSYTYVCRTLDSNPITSVAWTTGDLTSLQAAIKTIV